MFFNVLQFNHFRITKSLNVLQFNHLEKIKFGMKHEVLKLFGNIDFNKTSYIYPFIINYLKVIAYIKNSILS